MAESTAKTIDVMNEDGLALRKPSLLRRSVGWLGKAQSRPGWLIAVAVAPGFLAGAILYHRIYQSERAHLEQGALQTARALSLAVDRDLAGARGKLQILATTPALQSGDLRQFHALSLAVLGSDSLVESVALIDQSGRQVFDTLRPDGRELSPARHPEMLRRTFESGRPAVSDLYAGGVGNRPFVALAVPVWSADKIVYALDMSVSTERLNQLLIEQELPRGWVAALLDSQGTVIARSRDALRAIGQKAPDDLLAQSQLNSEGVMASHMLEGTPSFVAYTRSKSSDWSVVVGMPRSALHAAIAPALMLGGLAMLAFLLGGALLAAIFGRQVRAALNNLAVASEAATLGDLSAVAPLNGPREIVRLAEQFNRMQVTRRNDEAQLRLSASVFNVANEGIVIADRDIRIIDVNQAFTELTGYLRGEVVGLDPRFLKTERHAPAFYEAMLETLAATGRWQGDLWTRRKDDSVFATYMTISAVLDKSGRVAQFVAMFSDITDVQQRQDDIESLVEQRTRELAAAKIEAEKANNAKSRFLAAVSHDLRQPLAALSLYVAGLDKKLAASDPRLLANIKNCVTNLGEMLSDLLDLSKLQAGAVTTNVADFSLDAMLARIASFHAPEAQLKGLELRVRNINIFGHTDPVLFQRIVGNLVANAIRYTERGGILIGSRVRDGKIWVEVWDTGIGIPADKTADIFEEFKQLGNAERNGAKGSGLGLAIVAKTAALLGLQVRVRSRLGKGSMFAVELPLGQPLKLLMPRSATVRPARVVLIDDNNYVFAALACALSNAGHQVVEASTPAGILPLLNGQRPDFVIADYRLAGEEKGSDAIATLRARFGNDVPAIIITGNTDPALVRCLAKKEIGVMHKPVDLDTLLARIDEQSLRSS